MIMLFFFNDTATTEIYTLSLHDALPISRSTASRPWCSPSTSTSAWPSTSPGPTARGPSSSPPSRQIGEHTSELQSRQYLVCRLLLEKKKYIHLPKRTVF